MGFLWVGILKRLTYWGGECRIGISMFFNYYDVVIY